MCISAHTRPFAAIHLLRATNVWLMNVVIQVAFATMAD